MTEHDPMASQPSPSDERARAEELEAQAGRREAGIVAELLYFLAHEKKWWLAPIILVLLLLGLFVFLASTPVAPFIYPL